MIAHYVLEGLETFCNGFFCYLLAGTMFHHTKMRKHGWEMALLLTVLSFILDKIQPSALFSFLSVILFVTLSEHFVFQIKLMDAVALTGVYTIFLLVFDNLSMSVVGMVFGDSDFLSRNLMGFSVYRLAALVFSKALLFLFCLILRHFEREVFNVIRLSRGIVVAVLGLFGAISFISFSLKIVYAHGVVAWGAFFGLLLMLCYALYVYACYREKKSSDQLVQFHNSVSMEQYQELLRSYEMNSRNFHDMRNHMLAIGRLLDYGEIARAREYVRELVEVPNVLENTWTGNETIDYVLNIRRMRAEKEQMEFTIDADLIQYRKLSDKVLCAVLSNLLDNAVEACGKMTDGKKLIHVVIRGIHEMLMIKVINTFEEQPKKRGSVFVTTKRGGGFHGWGLKSVAASVESNGGEITCHADGGTFTVNVTFF